MRAKTLFDITLKRRKSEVDNLLRKKHKIFDYSIDLGCGSGEFAPILRKYTRYLVGVDHNVHVHNTKGYDELVQSDIRTYSVPPQTDSLFMFEVIEHIPKEDGHRFLAQNRQCFMMLSTPSKLYKNKEVMHVSLWSAADFSDLGFSVYSITLPFWERRKWGNIIFAVRD